MVVSESLLHHVVPHPSLSLVLPCKALLLRTASIRSIIHRFSTRRVQFWNNLQPFACTVSLSFLLVPEQPLPRPTVLAFQALSCLPCSIDSFAKEHLCTKPATSNMAVRWGCRAKQGESSIHSLYMALSHPTAAIRRPSSLP
jgi:hypothetical protein